jgi:hypothetical protein
MAESLKEMVSSLDVREDVHAGVWYTNRSNIF